MDLVNCISVVFGSMMNSVFGTALRCTCRSVKVGRFCYRWSSDCTTSESAGSVFSAVHPPCVFPSVCVSCVPDCVYSAACVQSPAGKGQQGCTGLTCMLFPFFLALSLLVTHTCSLKYRSNLGSVFSLSVRECMFRIAITDKMRSGSISSRRVSFKISTRLKGGYKLSIRDEMNTILGEVKKVQMR